MTRASIIYNTRHTSEVKGLPGRTDQLKTVLFPKAPSLDAYMEEVMTHVIDQHVVLLFAFEIAVESETGQRYETEWIVRVLVEGMEVFSTRSLELGSPGSDVILQQAITMIAFYTHKTPKVYINLRPKLFSSAV